MTKPDTFLDINTPTGQYVFAGPRSKVQSWYADRKAQNIRDSESMPQELSSSSADVKFRAANSYADGKKIWTAPIATPEYDDIAETTGFGSWNGPLPSIELDMSALLTKGTPIEQKNEAYEPTPYTQSCRKSLDIVQDRTPFDLNEWRDTIADVHAFLLTESALADDSLSLLRYCDSLVKDVGEMMDASHDVVDRHCLDRYGIHGTELGQVIRAFVRTLRCLHSDIVVFAREDDLAEVVASDRAQIHELVRQSIDICECAVTRSDNLATLHTIRNLRCCIDSLDRQHHLPAQRRESAKADLQSAINSLDLPSPPRDMLNYLQWCFRSLAQQGHFTMDSVRGTERVEVCPPPTQLRPSFSSSSVAHKELAVRNYHHGRKTSSVHEVITKSGVDESMRAPPTGACISPYVNKHELGQKGVIPAGHARINTLQAWRGRAPSERYRSNSCLRTVYI